MISKEAISPNLSYRIKVRRAVKIEHTWLRPGNTITVTGAILLAIYDDVSEAEEA